MLHGSNKTVGRNIIQLQPPAIQTTILGTTTQPIIIEMELNILLVTIVIK